MPLSSPNLDDRDFESLVQDARRIIKVNSQDWTDLSESDPGMVLVQLFAFLTETLLYRVNRLPEKAYIEFLNLIGVTLGPPAAAGTMLVFTPDRPLSQPVEIPRGTRVTLDRSGGGTPPVFATGETVALALSATSVTVRAHHAELIEGELAGTGTGLPGVSVTARRTPVVAASDEALELIVGVEATQAELPPQARTLGYGGKRFQIWREVDSFADPGPDGFVYTADRLTGLITFAPALQRARADGTWPTAPKALAAVPPTGREIRLWYRQGGGPDGNVAARKLTVLKDPIPGVKVTNPEPATGGRAAETLDNALLRGPLELHSLQRAVTARDFQLLALRDTGAVARAKAVTKAALWVHATPGTVEVLLVPYIPEAERTGQAVSAAMLQARETDEVRLRTLASLDERRPLGTTCQVGWVRYKTVRVESRVVVHRGQDPAAVRARVIDSLEQTINPLPTPLSPSGWPFGQPLRVSHVYDILLSDGGVSYVDRVRLVVDETPGAQVVDLIADVFQPQTWHAAAGNTTFRSVNNGDGWEPAKRFEGETVKRVQPHPGQAGLLAVITQPADTTAGSRLYVSEDCGETWRPVAQFAFHAEDMAWVRRDGLPVLLMVTDVGLYEIAIQPGSGPVQVPVAGGSPNLGFYAIAVSTDVSGTTSVAIAARGTQGIFLSSQAGRANTFAPIGLTGQDVRVLTVQQDGLRSFLWAGVWVAGNEAGLGPYRWELRGTETSPEGWRQFAKGWSGGSCLSLAFQGSQALAGTHHAGVLRLDPSTADPAWRAPEASCGLPLRDVGRFQPVVALDARADLVVTAGTVGIARSRDGGVTYDVCSNPDFLDRVTLPQSWLFCSGAHAIEVTSEDETVRD